MIVSPDRARVSVVFALGGLSAFGPLATDVYLPALPQIAADLGTSEPPVQLTLSVCMVGLVLGQLVVGPVSDRVGRRLPLLVGVAAFTVTAGLCALAPSIEALLALRFLCGFAGGAGVVVARAMVRDLYEGVAAARMYALVSLVMWVAPIFGPVLGGQLLLLTNWRGVFAGLCVIGLVLMLTAATRVETLPQQRRRSGGARERIAEMATVLRDPTFVGPALVQGLGMCGMFTYIAMGSFVLQGPAVDGPLDAQGYAWMFAVNAVGILVAGRISASLVGRFGPRRLLGAGIALGLAGAVTLLIGVFVTRSVWAMLPPLFLLVAATGLISPNATALALSRQGERAGSASGLVGLFHFGYAAVVPPLASLGTVSPVTMAIMIFACVFAACGIFMLLLGGQRTRAAQPAARTEAAGRPGLATGRPVVVGG